MIDSNPITTRNHRGAPPPIWAQIIIWVALLGLLAVVYFELNRSQQGQIGPGDQVSNFSMPLFSGYELTDNRKFSSPIFAAKW